MAHRRAHERDLQRAAEAVAWALMEHPDWADDPCALRDRLDGLIDFELSRCEYHDETKKLMETHGP